MSYNTFTPIVTDGLVLYLDAANTKSYPGTGTSWLDLSKNNLTGTLFNTPTFSTDNGGCFVFNGTTQYIEVLNNALLNSNTQTISIWYNASVLPGRQATIIGKHTSSGSWDGYNIWAGNQVQIKIGSADGGSLGLNNGVINTWYKLTLTYTVNSSMSFYVNGVLVGTTSLGNLAITSQSLRIGKSSDSFWTAFTGKIALVSIYNRVLTASEVLQNYNATKYRFQ